MVFGGQGSLSQIVHGAGARRDSCSYAALVMSVRSAVYLGVNVWYKTVEVRFPYARFPSLGVVAG